ncbi:MAG TPA: ATP-binding protein [Burkholderiaceae bacterium]|nr:ATP-binding protein [Burkholderiaceae bacterium]
MLLASTPAAATTAGSHESVVLAVAAGAVGAVLLLAAARWWLIRSPLRAARLALAAGADWQWQCDADLKVTDVQLGQRPVAGFDARSLIGRKPWQIAPDAEAPPALLAPIAARAAFFDVPVAVGAGTEHQTFVLSAAPLTSADGRFAGYAGVARETTSLLAHARAAAAPPRELVQLEIQHAERTRQLEVAVKELDSFSHSVSHDLRAPLRVVDGFANIVLEDYGEQLDELGREHLKRIVAAGQRMNAMIDTLLSLSRMTSREIDRERVDLSRLAHELADELRAQDQARATEFVLADGLVADGDRTLLRLVLQNLLGNAWKFSAKVARPRVEFAARNENGRSVYFVRDNGAGFDMRFAEKMFGLFQRFHSSNEFPGTGVGLATVQRIVRKHGGRIWADSQPGQGATFYFTLWENGRN